MATNAQNSRRHRTISLLETQLKSGVKTQKKTRDVKIPLTENDVKRLKSELEILKSRVR
jgi:hypothetical protein